MILPAEALFIEPQWDAAIAPPKGVGYDAVLKEEESERLPMSRQRLGRQQISSEVATNELIKRWSISSVQSSK